MKKAVLITGAGGFIGSAIARELRKRDFDVIGLDVYPKEDVEHSDAMTHWIRCDLTDPADIKSAFKSLREIVGANPLLVIHLAAHYDFSGEDSPLYDELTVGGTRRLLTGLQEFNVLQFQFASTILVMKAANANADGPGREASGRIDEEAPTDPQWRYPESKLEAEGVIFTDRGKIPAVIHRIAGVYNDWCHSPPISQQIARIFERKFESHFFPGNQSYGQPFIHVDDVAQVFLKTIESRESLGGHEIFLIGEPDLISYGDMQDLIGELIHQKDWATIRVPKAAAKLGAWIKDKLTEDDEFIQPWMIDLADAHYPIDIKKAMTKLSWQPEISLRDTLPVMIENLKADPEQWYEINGLQADDLSGHNGEAPQIRIRSKDQSPEKSQEKL